MKQTLLAATALVFASSQANAYVEIPYTLGRIVNESTNIVLMQVEKVNKERRLVYYRKVADLKGKHPTDTINHQINNGFEAREPKYVMDWAEPGKLAILFYQGGASETCIGDYWYQAYNQGAWWGMSHAEPFFAWAYTGTVEKLRDTVTTMLAGQEVTVTCARFPLPPDHANAAKINELKGLLKGKQAPLWRMRASLKITDFNAMIADHKKYLVGLGADDIVPLVGLAMFDRQIVLPRVDPGASVAALHDLDGDGKPDIVLAGDTRVALLANQGSAVPEVGPSLKIGGCGARSIAWADCDGDGKTDLLAAGPTGLRLFLRTADAFDDQSRAFPAEPAPNFGSAVWVDLDGDGKPDIAAAAGFYGLRLYRNAGAAPETDRTKDPTAPRWRFENVTETLLAAGVAGKVDFVAALDLDGDGKAELVCDAGGGTVFKIAKEGLTPIADAGLRIPPRSRPALADFDGDGKVDAFVPGVGGGRLWRNKGDGKFVDVTSAAGDLAAGADTLGAAWGDFDGDGKVDLLLGCRNAPNRLLRNNGNGSFRDLSAETGFDRRIFNTRAAAVADFDKDGVSDVLLANEGQDSLLLLGKGKAK